MPKSKLQLQQIIRFAIDQLSARNGAIGYFEPLCRHFARARICRNILPATGPVQAGGDQGRDFETFHSYLSQSSLASSSFIGVANKSIAFACSLEKNPEKAKIKSDVNTILCSGTPVERTYFFSGQDIPVAKRHKIQASVKEEKSINLEIIDAQALAEHLTDPDLFWIAVEFLDIPNEYCPIIEKDSDYASLRQSYTDRKIITGSFEEFSEIKSALRRIYKDDVLQVDLGFWFEKLDIFVNDSQFRDLKRKAIYEKYVAKLVGQKDIAGLESNVRDYFSDFTDYASPSKLEDATILLNFVRVSKGDLGHDIPLEEINTWISQLRETTKNEFDYCQNDGKKCWLCLCMALQASFFDEHQSLNEKFSSLVFGLNTVIPFLANAQFFPFDKLTYFLFDIQDWCLEFNIDEKIIRQFEDISEQIDNEIGKRAGSLAAGENLRIRALKYFEAERYLLALEISHKLKIKWLDHNSPEGLIHCSRLIARCYEKIGMCYAAKYYGMIATHIIVEENDIDLQKHLPQSLKELADTFYSAGDWLGYFDVATMALGMHSFISKDFDIYAEDKENVSFLFNPTVIKYVANRFNLSAANMIDYRISKWQYISDEIEEFYPQLKSKYATISDAQLLKEMSQQLYGKPFNELGKTRAIQFQLLGIEWIIEFDNNYETTILAEQFVSTLQIVLVELHKHDLLLLKTTVLIRFKNEAKFTEPQYKSVSNNEKIIWDIAFSFINKPLQEAGRDYFIYVGIAMAILNEASLMPQEALIKSVHEKFESGDLGSSTLFASSYEKLYPYFIKKELFHLSQRQDFTNENVFYEVQNTLPDELNWKNTLVDFYDKALFEQYVVNRNNFIKPFEITFPKLLISPDFQNVVQNLRNKKWLDWQITMAAKNVIITYKMQKLNLWNSSQMAFQIADNLSNKSEKETFMPIPDNLLTEKNIEYNLKTLQPVSVLESFKLQSKTPTPNCEAILEFLTFRLNYMEDGKHLTIL